MDLHLYELEEAVKIGKKNNQYARVVPDHLSDLLDAYEWLMDEHETLVEELKSLCDHS